MGHLPRVRSVRLLARLIPRRPVPFTSVSYRPWDRDGTPRGIIAIGDLQRTILAERIYLARRQNDDVRLAILRRVAEEHPDVLLLLGDQVADGASVPEWEYFDELMEPVRESGAAVHALLGNHDYSPFDRERSVRNFLARFPAQRDALPEAVQFGDIVYVGLDSNFTMIGPTRVQRQAAAYRDLLNRLDRDPQVRGVIVASHHPPYSNSTLRNTDPVREMFARPFLKARKTLLYLSAHVHSYERFVVDGRSFVVSGGGGGPRRRVDVSEGRPWKNDIYREAMLRPFHYLRIEPRETELHVEVVMLNEPKRSWRRRTVAPAPVFAVGDRFGVEYRA